VEVVDTGTAPPATGGEGSELQRAVADFERALRRFRALRCEAFAGAYDADAFDLAILHVRASAARVRATAGEKRPAGTPDPLAGLSFARWLVRTRPLSNQIARPPAPATGPTAMTPGDAR
jgi:hypothetical protein